MPTKIEVHCHDAPFLGPFVVALLALTIPAFVSAAVAAPASAQVRLTNKGGRDRILMSTHRVKAAPVEFHIKNISKIEMHEYRNARIPHRAMDQADHGAAL